MCTLRVHLRTCMHACVSSRCFPNCVHTQGWLQVCRIGSAYIRGYCSDIQCSLLDIHTDRSHTHTDPSHLWVHNICLEIYLDTWGLYTTVSRSFLHAFLIISTFAHSPSYPPFYASSAPPPPPPLNLSPSQTISFWLSLWFVGRWSSPCMLTPPPSTFCSEHSMTHM